LAGHQGERLGEVIDAPPELAPRVPHPGLDDQPGRHEPGQAALDGVQAAPHPGGQRLLQGVHLGRAPVLVVQQLAQDVHVAGDQAALGA